MTDAEISRRLALAIGWEEDQNDPNVIIEFDCKDLEQTAKCKVWFDDSWREFDYRDPDVIWPIAERFDCFPVSIGNRWASQKSEGSPLVFSDTAAKAVAMAVIKANNT